jgi:hypothetical protein
MDIAQPKKHLHHPGYTIDERVSFEKIKENYIDVYRHLYPDS